MTDEIILAHRSGKTRKGVSACIREFHTILVRRESESPTLKASCSHGWLGSQDGHQGFVVSDQDKFPSINELVDFFIPKVMPKASRSSWA